MKKLFTGVAVLLALMVIQGCASRPITAENSSATVRQRTAADPLEGVNRTIFGFNDGVDRVILRPVATVYRDVLPAPIRRGVTNVFSNVNDIVSLMNNALQLKGVETSDTLFRVTVNTFWGIGGIFDVAGEMKIPKHTEDFGQTLGYWGMPAGPYLVLPILGPSSVRDAGGRYVDSFADLVRTTDDVYTRNSLTLVRAVDARANYLGAGNVLEEAALDKYSFTREIYLQRRKALIGKDIQPEERFDLPEASTNSTTGKSPALAQPTTEPSK